MRARGLFSGLLSAVLAACGETAPSAPRQLVDHRAWLPLPSDEDPFFFEGSQVCPDTEWGLADEPSIEPSEGGSASGVLQVHTEICNYLTLTQPSTARVSKGDYARIAVWHTVLDKLQPTSGTIAIAIDGERIWQHPVSARSAGAAFAPVWIAPRDVRAGAPVWFHVDNHGKNTYRLGDVVATTASR